MAVNAVGRAIGLALLVLVPSASAHGAPPPLTDVRVPSAGAQKVATPAPPMTSDEISRARAGEAVTVVAERARAIVAQQGLRGLGEIRVDPAALGVQIAWKGTPPPAIVGLAGSAGRVQVRIVAAAYSKSDLDSATDRVWQAYGDRSAANRSPLVLDLVMLARGASGLTVSMKPRSPGASVDPGTAARVRADIERTAGVRVVGFDVTAGGGLIVGHYVRAAR